MVQSRRRRKELSMSMSRRRRLHIMVALACVIGLASMLSGPSAFSARSDQGRVAKREARPFKVTTTLVGRLVLPHRIHWVARTSLPAAKVGAVTFLIDGKISWIEHLVPYTYGLDGNWLVTSWLTPGTHRFTARVTEKGGRTATSTTIARVLPAPKPPSELNDTRWTRTYPSAEAGDGPPAGRWTLKIDSTGWQIIDPNGEGALIDVAYLGPGLLETRGGIWTKPKNPYEGQAWCEDTNEPVRFTWKAESDSLRFAFVPPGGCADFGPFMSRTWSRTT
jgi:hypothetical protein